MRYCFCCHAFLENGRCALRADPAPPSPRTSRAILAGTMRKPNEDLPAHHELRVVVSNDNL